MSLQCYIFKQKAKMVSSCSWKEFLERSLALRLSVSLVVDPEVKMAFLPASFFPAGVLL